MSGFNYNKWDNIELSDDESDLHPNIDKDSWFRMKHRSRLEREEKEDQEIQVFIQKNSEDTARLNIINARVKGIQSGENDEDAEFDDMEALEVEKKELETQIGVRNARIKEINERRSWNIDNICKVKDEKTIVGKPTASSLEADISSVDEAKFEAMSAEAEAVKISEQRKSAPNERSSTTTPPTSLGISASTGVSASSTTTGTTSAVTASTTATVPRGAEPAASVKRERMAVISYNDFAINHETVLETFSEVAEMEATKEYLFKHCDILLHEHAQNYMLLSCLEDEMNGKKKRMKQVCRQSQILSHITDLGKSMKRDPRDVILPFFVRIQEKSHFEGFLSSVDDFIKRIQKRAVEKRREMDKERALAARQEAIDKGEAVQLGPGGLDPIEVLESLPEALRDAFESQDLEQLQNVLAHMKPKEAKDCMKRCVDSGLWVPSDQSIFENEEELEEEEDEGEEEEEAADSSTK
mmetsp:Transcript_14165/g.23568  ORF Transcript_14165/g.23568 Transcript_14165/m.23568 type:complete len:469 (+) Transcript_14165:66-1472(+)